MLHSRGATDKSGEALHEERIRSSFTCNGCVQCIGRSPRITFPCSIGYHLPTPHCYNGSKLISLSQFLHAQVMHCPQRLLPKSDIDGIDNVAYKHPAFHAMSLMSGSSSHECLLSLLDNLADSLTRCSGFFLV